MSILIVFGKYFSLLKFQKIQKLCNSVLASHSCGSSQSRAYSEALATLWQVCFPIAKNTSKNFGFLAFSRLSLATWSWVEAPVVSLLRMIRDFLTSGLLSREKHLRQIFQKFCQGILATHVGNLLATHSSRENHVFCTNRFKSMTVFKNFSVFPHITPTHFVLSASPSSKTSIFSHKTSIFFINSSSIFKKMFGFSIISKVFHVSIPRFLGFCVYVEIWKYDDWIWFCWCFFGFDVWVLLVLLV